MTKVVGNENTERYFTWQFVDRSQMKKVQRRAVAKAREMMRI